MKLENQLDKILINLILGDYPHYPTTLQKLKDWVSSDKKCLDVDKYYNPTQQICIGGSAKGGTGACRGDSGSAFQCKGTDGRYYQVKLCQHNMSRQQNGTLA